MSNPEAPAYHLMVDDDNSGCVWLISTVSLEHFIGLLADDISEIFGHKNVSSVSDETIFRIIDKMGMEEELTPVPGAQRWTLGQYNLTGKQAQTFIDIANMKLLDHNTIEGMFPDYDDEDAWEE